MGAKEGKEAGAGWEQVWGWGAGAGLGSRCGAGEQVQGCFLAEGVQAFC